MKHIATLIALSLIAACQAPTPALKNEPAGLLEGIPSGKTVLIDLGHALNSKKPYWPGPGYEPFKFEIFATNGKVNQLSG